MAINSIACFLSSCFAMTQQTEKLNFTLRSLKIQSYRNFEVILLGPVTDGKTMSMIPRMNECTGEPLLAIADILSNSDKCRWRGEFALYLKAETASNPTHLIGSTIIWGTGVRVSLWISLFLTMPCGIIATRGASQDGTPIFSSMWTTYNVPVSFHEG